MSIKSDLFTALKSLVTNRVYPDTFPQAPAVPVWPAIRYSLISGTVWPDICGSGYAPTDDVRIQIDIVDATSAGRDALVTSVRAALITFTPPAVLDGPASEEYDAETKTFRASFDYVIYGSSS